MENFWVEFFLNGTMLFLYISTWKNEGKFLLSHIQHKIANTKIGKKGGIDGKASRKFIHIFIFLIFFFVMFCIVIIVAAAWENVEKPLKTCCFSIKKSLTIAKLYFILCIIFLYIFQKVHYILCLMFYAAPFLCGTNNQLNLITIINK